MNNEEFIRMNVRVNRKSHPELFDALVKLEKNFRGERFRSLALMGLVGGNNSQSLVENNPKPEKEVTVVDEPIDEEMSDFLGGITSFQQA
jgi:hypothetical protein